MKSIDRLAVVLLAVVAVLLHGTAVADRAPVLKQIALPHDYYFREMYLPQLTSSGDVNLDPRWSPDGTRLAFVSTRGTGRFHVFIGSVGSNGMESAPLMPERKSTTPRYYYDEYDHELSPSWSPDGSEILYVSNPEIIYGSGAIWRRPLDASRAPVQVRIEETTWRARPDWSPDGERIAYVTNEGGGLGIRIQTVVSGKVEPLEIAKRDYLRPTT